MLYRLFRLAGVLGRWRATMGLRHARKLAVLWLAFGLFALLFVGFGGTILLVLLARWIGILGAFGVATGIAGLVLLVLGWALLSERQEHRLRLAVARRDRDRFVQTALLLTGAARGSTLVVAGLAVLAVFLLGRRGRDQDDPPDT